MYNLDKLAQQILNLPKNVRDVEIENFERKHGSINNYIRKRKKKISHRTVLLDNQSNKPDKHNTCSYCCNLYDRKIKIGRHWRKCCKSCANRKFSSSDLTAPNRQ
jgi:hypothetical protein